MTSSSAAFRIQAECYSYTQVCTIIVDFNYEDTELELIGNDSCLL